MFMFLSQDSIIKEDAAFFKYFSQIHRTGGGLA